IVIGTGVDGRGAGQLEGIIGMFVNTLGLRNVPRSNDSFRDFLAQLKINTLQAFENQDYPFEDIVDRLDVKRDTSRNPLFDVMFQFNNYELPEIKISGLNLKPYRYDRRISKFDLTLWGWERDGQWVLAFEYGTQLFKRETIEWLIQYFHEITDAVISDPNRKLIDVRQISQTRKQQLLQQINRDLETEAQRMKENGQIFQHQLNRSLERFEDKTAIECGLSMVSYGELNKRSRQIAGHILRKGIPKGTFIGVLIEDRINFILAMIGILESGCVFIPLDGDLPQSRLRFMMDTTGMLFIIADKIIQTRSGEVIPINDCFEDGLTSAYHPLNLQYHAEDKVYIYFTSGSAGTPKAIVGKSIGLLHFIQWEIDTLGIDETVNVSQLTAVGFDAFLRDVFVPLFSGGRLCIPSDPEIRLDSEALAQWFWRSRINLIHSIPSLFRQLEPRGVNAGNFKYPRYVLLSGERINASDLVNWFETFGERITFVNLYGPTETTMTKTFHFIGKDDLKRPRIPVGNPMRGAGVLVLDKNMNVCDPLVTGDIYICTPYVTHGYFNDPLLNDESFLEIPFVPINSKIPAIKLYKTGDIGMLLPGGGIDLKGRIDRQVKLRGIRIELGEVETILQAHPQVSGAVVIKRAGEAEDNEFLCAYVTTGATVTSEIESYLKDKLPAYMVPSRIVPLEEIPRTPNGKIDYKALENLEEKQEDYIAPANDIEQKLRELWAGVINAERIGVTDNFFALGGNSLNVLKLIARVFKEFKVLFPLGDIFNNPTIREQAQLITGGKTEEYSAIQPVEEKEYYPLSSAQKRLYVLQQMDDRGTGYNMPGVMELEGELDHGKLRNILLALIKRHESFRTSFIIAEGEPVQKVHKPGGIDFKIDHYETGEDEGKEIIAGFSQPFELHKPPLLRVMLVKTGDKRHILALDMHHIISDGTS
ncbi:MAG: amino acid adenylation domain-containing protein, partial [bacterium]|nr:amino acid adenylation domain-containing protein [bacterium]